MNVSAARYVSIAAFAAIAVFTASPARIAAQGPAQVIVSEVHPSGSGNATYKADWIELTNIGATAVSVAGWKIDDNSNAFASAVALRGVTLIPAGKSVVFFEGDATGSTDAAILASFSTAWFGTATPPPGVLIGAYGGSGVGLGSGGDAVNVFDASGARVTGVAFGSATAVRTFDNAAGIGGTTLPLPLISTLSTAGVNGAFTASGETGSPGRIAAPPSFSSIDLSRYVRIARFPLPEPTTVPPPPNSRLAQEVSGITYNWDTDTLFVIGDGSTSVVQITKTGQLIDSMTLAPGSSPQGTEFYDTEGITYVGGGQFILVEERDRQVVLFTYMPGGTLTRALAKTIDLGTFAPNTGIEGLSYDPLTGGIIAVKEIAPQGIFQTDLDFIAGTASNGSPTTENSIDLFDPALIGLLDFADVFALSNLATLSGPEAGNLLVLSQESGRIVNVDRSGNIASALTILPAPGQTIAIPDQQHEGLTMDANGILYVVSENGGGDIDHPEMWVYAPTDAPNQAPTGVALVNQVNSIAENTTIAARLKVADIMIADDGLGALDLSVSGADAASFEIDLFALYLKAGTTLDFETKPSYSITVSVDDPTVGASPDASAPFTLTVTDVFEVPPTPPAIAITEVAPWGSGSTPYASDWFELTNTGTTPIAVNNWRMDDDSSSFGTARLLTGVASIAPGESVIFMETANLAATSATFRTTWFGSADAGPQIGAYTGAGVGLSTGGDAVTIFDGGGFQITKVTFGVSPGAPFRSFDNAAGNSGAITQLSAAGVNGAFVSAGDAAEIGSPGTIYPDTIAPVIDPVADVTVIVTGIDGAVATYETPAAHDNVDFSVEVSCIPASGSVFPFGDTTVSCTAADAAGNEAAPSTFTVHVTVTSAALQALVSAFSTDPDVTSGLNAKLIAAESASNANAQAGHVGAFENQVRAQTGKALTAQQAAVLLQLVQALY